MFIMFNRYMKTHQLNEELLYSMENPKVVKELLKMPNINVSYSSKSVSTFKNVTPVLYVFATIFTNSIMFDPKTSPNKIKNLLESAELMVKHRTYKENFKYEFVDDNIHYIIQASGTKNGKVYSSLVESGFTLKSFANNTKLTNAFIEDRNIFNNQTNTKEDKERINKTLQEVKKILNSKTKSFPITEIIIVLVVFLILSGLGFFGYKKYKK